MSVHTIRGEVRERIVGRAMEWAVPVGRGRRAGLSAWLLAWGLGCVVSTASAAVPAGKEPAKDAAKDSNRTLIVQALAAQKTEQRLALVIGNSAYKNAPLPNPVNDARAMNEALQRAGFTVMLRTDVDLRDMMAAVRDFGAKLQQGGVGIFYFAGHGMQIKGRNYLIPVGADIEREDEAAYQALDAQAVLDKMETAGNGTNVMILDACRNNPFARSVRSGSSGLAQMDAPVGTLVAFATSPGSVSSDGTGRNGLYTQHLLKAIEQPGLKLEDVFKQVRAAVRRESQGRQVPWESTSLEGDFYFNRPAGGTAPGAAPMPESVLEQALWEAVSASRQPLELQAYLGRFPNGPHAAAVRERLASLGVAPAVTPPTTVASANPKPVQATARGYAVGDKWRYQLIDRTKGEVSRNYAIQITGLEADGSWTTASGSRYDEFGRPIVQQDTASGNRSEYSQPQPRWWNGMKPGQTHKTTYIRKRSKDGSTFLQTVDSTATYTRDEVVKVPAGEFQTQRIDVVADVRVERDGNYTGSYRWEITYWYAPALRMHVASEFLARNQRNNVLDSSEREELTSYDLKVRPVLAGR